MVFGLLTSSTSSGNSTTIPTSLCNSRPGTPPSRPDTPELQLNGRPIAAPTSFASPQTPLRRRRLSSPTASSSARTTKTTSAAARTTTEEAEGSSIRMGRKSTGGSRDVRQRKNARGHENNSSNNGANSDASADTLKPGPYTARNNQGNAGAAGSRTSVKQAAMVQPKQPPRRRTKPARPSPWTQPVSYFRFLTWRTRVYFDATFSLGMLAEWEVWLVGECTENGLPTKIDTIADHSYSPHTATIAILSAFVLLYSLFFQFPKHFQTVMKRATYYVWGVGSSALSQQQTQQQHPYLQQPVAGIPVVGPDGESTVAL